MLHQEMLYEKRIVNYIISNVEMRFFHCNSIWFKAIRDVEKNTNLCGALVHALDLVLNLKSVVLCKIYI